MSNRRLNNEEYADMHLVYGETFRNRAEARRIYLALFPQRQISSERVFDRVNNSRRKFLFS